MHTMETHHITDESELVELAQHTLSLLIKQKPTDAASVLALHGDLGAGKTAFTKVLAKTLGVTGEVTSPTFVVMKLYPLGEVVASQEQPFTQLAHIDAYRVEDIDEMRVLRFEELLGLKDTIICIEWAERIASLLPAHTLHMNWTIEGISRTVTFS